jgi:hypothetical protein
VNEPTGAAALLLRLRAPHFGTDPDSSAKVDIEPRLRELAEEFGVDPEEAVQTAYQIVNRLQRQHR